MSPPAAPSSPAVKGIAATFADLRSRGRIGLMPFIAGGFPDLETTTACITALADAGASLIEIGFPFSDPIADGPTIQEAFTYALAKKVKVADVFAAVAKARPTASIPFVGMLSYSIVFRYGLDRFLKNAKAAGFDGLILPDLPPPEAQTVCGTIRAAGLDTVLLIAPTTTPQRRREIADLCSGFVYYLSISGITGERTQLPADLEDNLRKIKTLTDKPVCVGFGINSPEHVKQLRGVADGAIVGSAFVRRMKQLEHAGPQAIAKALGDYYRELLG